MATMFPNIPIAQTYRAPGPYDEDYRSIARREQLAQILQQQALQPIEAGSYQGIQAPISPLSGIAKVLQGYFAGRQSDDADQARQDLALKAQNAGLALSNLPPIEAKPKQLAQALNQTPSNTTAFSEGSSFTPTQQPTEPVMPISMPGITPTAQTQAPQAMPMLFSDPRVNARFVSSLGDKNI